MIENQDAQFMLLAGFIIAIGLVVATVMLNNVIFEGNIASEAGTEPAKYDTVNLLQTTRDEARSAYASAQGANSTLRLINFSRQMNNSSAALSEIYALHGEGIDMSWSNGINGYFTENGAAGGAANWTVIQNVNSSNITVNITGAFSINITNTTSSWRIDLLAGNYFINNTNISSHIASPYSIIFLNGANAQGRFNITGITSGANFTRARDYLLNFTVTFATSRIRFNITFPVSVPR